MTNHQNHATDEELILHFYGEAPAELGIERHLAQCDRCRDEFARLQGMLALVDSADGFAANEEPGPAFEREVWARLEPQLAGARPSWRSRLFGRVPRVVWAGGVAALMVAAFVAGRVSSPAPDTAAGGRAESVAERVLVVAVVDHLDRSQMVLLEVMNADVESAGDLSAEQSLARELVAANRLYRQTATQTGDGTTSDVLDELERVLVEFANTPQDATRADLDALRARIASRGLLFKVRVVHSQMRERERQTLLPGSQS